MEKTSTAFCHSPIAPPHPGHHDLRERVGLAALRPPAGIVPLHGPDVGSVADVIPRPGIHDESFDESSHVGSMDVVADLLAVVAEHRGSPALTIACYEGAQKSVQFHTRMGRAGQTATPQAAGRHPKIAAILLHHHVSGDLRSLIRVRTFRDQRRQAVGVMEGMHQMIRGSLRSGRGGVQGVCRVLAEETGRPKCAQDLVGRAVQNVKAGDGARGIPRSFRNVGPRPA